MRGGVAVRPLDGRNLPLAARPARWRAAGFAAALVALVAGVVVVPRYLRAAALVVDAAGIEGWPHTLAGWNAAAFRAEDRVVPSRHGPVRARLYVPEGRPRRALLLAPGVHAAGMDEARLVDFAGHLASRGYVVLTPDLPDFRRYHVTARTTDTIEDAALWLATRSGVADNGRVGVVGISFAGGLAVAAAGRPALRDHVAFVLSVGGHGDLDRTLRFLCTGVLDDGTRLVPHDYGVAIVLLAVAAELVPPAQVEGLRSGILTFLEASQADTTNKPRAGALFDRARRMERDMAEPAALLLRLVNRRAVEASGPLLLPYVPALASDPALSPERSFPPAAPVYLLHGATDNVIPTLESRLLARHLERHTRVALLVTPLLTHAEARPSADLRETWKVVAFWAAVLDE